MRITEITDDNFESSKVYKGPTSDFPYKSYKILGIAHIVFSVCILVCGVVHTTLSYDDRKFFLLTGSVSIWCPLFGIGLGAIGVSISRKRYWEVECLRTAFVAVSALTHCAMIALILVMVLLDFYYYGIIENKPAESFDLTRKQFSDEEEKDGYVTLMALIVAFAGCEYILSFITFCIGCCCSPIYEPEKTKGFQTLTKPKAQPEYSTAPQQMVIANGKPAQQPTHFLQPVLIPDTSFMSNPMIQASSMIQAPPSVMVVPSVRGTYSTMGPY